MYMLLGRCVNNVHLDQCEVVYSRHVLIMGFISQSSPAAIEAHRLVWMFHINEITDLDAQQSD